MDNRLSVRIQQYPDEIAKMQDSLQDILNKISLSTEAGDDMQLRLLVPRLSYLRAMIEALKGDMNDTLEGIAETDSVTRQVVMQQILLLDNLYGQLSGIADTISVSLKALDESSKQTLMAEIMKRCSDLKAAAKELE